MKKSFRLIALCLSLLMVFAFAACSSNEGNSGDSSGQGSGDSAKLEKGVTADTIKVAYILPFTGPSAQYGDRQKNAMTMVAEKWNNAGGINGRKIEVEYFDDKNEKTETAIVANQIVGRDDIFCCFGPFSRLVH